MVSFMSCKKSTKVHLHWQHTSALHNMMFKLFTLTNFKYHMPYTIYHICESTFKGDTNEKMWELNPNRNPPPLPVWKFWNVEV